jgi:hypothetical protein
MSKNPDRKGQKSAREVYWWCSVLMPLLAIMVNKASVKPERLRVGKLKGGAEAVFGALADIKNAAGETVARMPVVFADTKGVGLFKAWLEVRKGASGLEAKDDQKERGAIIKYLEGLLEGTMAGVMNLPDFSDAEYLRKKEKDRRAMAPRKLSVIVLDPVDGVHDDSDDDDDDDKVSGPKARVMRYERLNSDKVFGGNGRINVSQVRDGSQRGGMYMVDINNPPYIEIFGFIEPGARVETEFHGRRLKGGNQMTTVYVSMNEAGDIVYSYDTYTCDRVATAPEAKPAVNKTEGALAGNQLADALKGIVAPPPKPKAEDKPAVATAPTPPKKDEVPVDLGDLNGPPGSQGKEGDKKVANG